MRRISFGRDEPSETEELNEDRDSKGSISFRELAHKKDNKKEL